MAAIHHIADMTREITLKKKQGKKTHSKPLQLDDWYLVYVTVTLPSY